MKNKKLLMRLLCALLSMWMLVCMVPAVAVSAEAETEPETGDEGSTTTIKWNYESPEACIADMTKYFDNGEYSLYCNEKTGVVAYKKNSTGEILFTNPYDMSKETNTESIILDPLKSQIVLEYSGKGGGTLTSYDDAVKLGQYSISPIQNGVRVEYAMGQISARILVPMRIERTSFEEKILAPLEKELTTFEYAKFMAYFSLKKQGGIGIATAYPVTEEKGIDIYVCNADPAQTKVMRELEAKILEYCPDYSFAQLDEDYELVDYEYVATSPAVFRMALEYTVDANGLSVSLPANGLRYDESAYRITDLQILPYMGASYKGNPNRVVVEEDPESGEKIERPFDGGLTYSGYTFIPDGSGALYELSTNASRIANVYGEDYGLLSITGTHTTPMRMPVYGQVETVTDKDGNATSRGYLAIIEEGESLASLSLHHTQEYYTCVVPSFITRPTDRSKSEWSVYASRRYSDDYKLRYIILTDDAKAQKAGVSRYYECSWMGMACAYRDYLDAKNNGFERLSAEDLNSSIPLYIETFGCMDTVKKVMSVPVTVSVSLTSFEDIQTMYEYLSGQSVTNVNFKLTGYANGGLYAEVPYKLKWEKAVGGKSDFKDLVEYAAAHPELGLFPDFDFVYTQNPEGVDMKEYAARTIDNRYTSKRSYSITQQTMVSHFQMVLSPSTFNHFYEKLEKKYSKYKNASISLSTLGSDLNSSYKEEDVSLREDSKAYTMQALDYFSSKGYDVMIDGGNAYTWSYADYILDVPLTSNRFNKEYATVPFMGVVLHGYVQFAGTPLNMEGNLTYAMLKAMESGAGIYFILSYTNTELLKEDAILSQNYSVRYDIWQKRLVEIYQELNAVLADVQDKLIIDHVLLDGTRVPDEDELLSDTLAEIEKQAAAVKKRLENINAASVSITQTLNRLNGYLAKLNTQYAAVQAQRETSSAFMNALNTYLADNSYANERALLLALTTYVAHPLAELVSIRANVEALYESAAKNLQFLEETGAAQNVVYQARAELSEINQVCLDIVSKYGELDESFTDDNDTVKSNFNDATKYAAVSVEDLIRIYDKFLVANGVPTRMALSAKNKSGIVDKLSVALVINPEPVVEGTVVESDTTNNDYKYAVDGEIVLVTYGDYDENGSPVAYKSLILNFNDYAVKTTIGGVTYSIAAYDYVVIMHNANS